MNGKKLLALLLAMLMLLPILVSCKNDDNKPTANSGTSTQAEPGEQDTIRAYVKDLATKVDCQGKTFAYIGRGESENFPIKEEETGNSVSDAVYYRQRDLEDIFGIDWTPVKTEGGDDTTDKVINEVMAGGDAYDLAQGNMTTVGQDLFSAGVIQNTDAFKYVDLDREWWIQSLRDNYAIKGQLFFVSGSILVEHFQEGSRMLFNKDVAEMFGIDEAELYQTVKDGDWTLDKMIEIASKVPVNSNGSGVYRYLDPVGVEFIFSSGMTITKFDEEGMPYVETALPVEISNLADKLSAIFGDTSQTAQINHKIGESYDSLPKKYGVEHIEELFVNNQALFYTNGSVEELRQEEVTFGILPFPKGSDTQQDYISYAGTGTSAYFPKTTKDVDVTGVITEAMAALGQLYIKEAYYDKLLKGQSVFDMESSDMLDIIFNTKVYDLAPIYSGGNMNWSGQFLLNLDDAIRFDSGNLASGYASQSRVANANIKMFIKKLQ